MVPGLALLFTGSEEEISSFVFILLFSLFSFSFSELFLLRSFRSSVDFFSLEDFFFSGLLLDLRFCILLKNSSISSPRVKMTISLTYPLYLKI